MRILLLSSVEHHSGSALRFRGLAGALARRGHEVHLLEPVPADTDPETPAGVHRHPCPRLPGRPEPQVPIWAWHSLAALRRSRPRVCWTLKALPNVWPAVWAARRRGVRVAVDLDDLDWGYYPPGPARSVLRSGFERLASVADDVTVHNEPMRELVRGLRAGKSEPAFVDQGIEPERFAGVPADPALRRELALGDGPVLLYAGHLGPASDLEPLLPALGALRGEFPEARLLVVGDGRRRASLERQVGEHLPGMARFAGAVAHARVAAYYALADVALNYLEPTEANRYRASIKLREALAAGVPVVSTRTPDAERFVDWVRGVEGRPGAFVEAVREELRHPDRTRAAAGRAWLAEHGTHDVAVRPIAERWEGSVA